MSEVHKILWIQNRNWNWCHGKQQCSNR